MAALKIGVMADCFRLPALDAHLQHPAPFSFGELHDYAHASVPVSQVQACARRTLMRQARSKTARPLLLAALERRYQDTS